MSKKLIYTKKLGANVASAAKSESIGKYHVISTSLNEKWAVVPKGSVHAIRSFTTQKDAVSFARETAMKKNGEVVVHRKNGEVKIKYSFSKK